MIRSSIGALALMIFVTVTAAQPPRCEDGRCEWPRSGRSEWRQRDDVPGEAYLFIDGVQVGGYQRDRDEWRDFDGRVWSAPRALFTPRAAEPFAGVEERATTGAVRNFG